MRLSRRNPVAPRRWSVWSLPRRVLVPIALVEVAAIALVVLEVRLGGFAPPTDWLCTLLVLAVAGIVSTEACLGVERRRRIDTGSPHIDLSSVWIFAAAALLPGPLAAVVVVVVYSHLYLRAWRRTREVAPHKVAFSAAAIVLAAQAAALVFALVPPVERFRSTTGLVVVGLAVVCYAVVNMLLVVVVMVLAGPSRDLGTFLRVLGRVDEAVLELATLSMGALAAGAMAAFGPAYAVFVLPTLIVLHRTVLVRQLEEAADLDGKTGLLNAAGWHVHATRALRRSERAAVQATVLVLDIDHFKDVNDRHGHLVGDQVLTAVAAAVKDEVREEDLVGRFGGEEFVVLLVGLDGGTDPRAARMVAERIRKRIAGLRVPVVDGASFEVQGLTVSIGGATFPADGSELVDLIQGADTAMYAAKRAGRNTVRMGAEPASTGRST
jgi:diguanylate cyclase (GGDEF)-like protein